MDIPQEVVDFVKLAPPAAQDLMRRFPPNCIIRTKLGVKIPVPLPGGGYTGANVEVANGQVVSVFADGRVGFFENIDGVPFMFAVDQSNIEFVRDGGPMSGCSLVCTREMIAEILDKK